MNTSKIIAKIKLLVKQYKNEIYLSTCLILVAGISYNLGYRHSITKVPPIDQNAQILKTLRTGTSTPEPLVSVTVKINPASHQPGSQDLRVVASRASRSKLYHFSWCSGAKRIKETNKIWFNNEQEAIQTGYVLASNCTK